jgi:hypothetical protein
MTHHARGGAMTQYLQQELPFALESQVSGGQT